MKILELTNFSSGLCGVFVRVKQEAELLAKKGHEVRIFSSNLSKGTYKKVPERDSIGNIQIRRFKATHLGGESFINWNFESSALKFKPDVIIAHSYRHPHTIKALSIAKKLRCKVFLVTHAPFGRNDSRSLLARWIVSLYDKFIGPPVLKKFTKIISITHWEIPYLHEMGIRDDQIVYIPNGISEEFFKLKTHVKEEKAILFLGRIAPIKNIETVIRALPSIKDKTLKFKIVGLPERDYLDHLKKLIRELQLEERISFDYEFISIPEKIKKIDSCKFFVLPSISEGMPQSLIEGLARKRIVFASDNLASKDLIANNKNGLLFPIGDSEKLAEIINNIKGNKKNMRNKAKKSVEQFSWNRVIKKMEKIISS